MRTVLQYLLLYAVTITWPVALKAEDRWPSHRGPKGNYQLSSAHEYPIQWSAITSENIRWRKPLPETGHSGIAVWDDRLFLTCFRTLTPEDHRQGKKGRLETWAAETRGYCLSSETGEILWSCDLPGKRPNQVNGVFTDSTTPTPITDGKHVWFINAGGYMACYTVEGLPVWEKPFDVRTKHSAKQFQPFLHDQQLYYAMLRDPDDPQRREQTAADWDKNSKGGWPWLYVRRFNALTGEPAGLLPGGISCHSRGALGLLEGQPVLFSGRGGSHFPPEQPAGLELSTMGNPLTVRWNQPGLSLEGTDHLDQEFAYSFTKHAILVLDLRTGKTHQTLKLPESAPARLFDESRGSYMSAKVSPRNWRHWQTHHTHMNVGQYTFFMGGKPGLLGRCDRETGTFSFLQVPVQQALEGGKLVPSWTKFQAGDGTGSGFQVEGDPRRLGNGFGHVTAATPVVINQRLYFTTMLGTVYVIDGMADTFDEHALLSVNDLGSPGRTWTLSSVTPAGGRLYQRTSREIICIGQ